MSGIPAFPKILHLGSKMVEHIYEGPIEVTEKLDGSQFSFGLLNGELVMRSKGKQIFPEKPESMFKDAVELATSCSPPEGVVIHGEFFKNPKHNTLKYNEKPKSGFAIFGARRLPDHFLPYEELVKLAESLGCDVVPIIYEGTLDKSKSLEDLDEWLKRESSLGGVNIEGVVLKNYTQTGNIAGHILPILCAKYVSEEFKEKHKVGWGTTNPTNMEKISQALGTEARWNKAIQFLRDCGELEGSPRDIGPLLKRIHLDINEEEQADIKDMLWNLFRKDILRTACRGFPEWYKRKLLEGES